ncbi:protein of unknown function DUF3444 - like 1 [Theobroma cacao]|nr:protein of unknown function DUF3444 - like 1 [Theobroma cacao]
MAPDPDAVQEAQRLKALAETKYKNSNLKSALKHAKKAHRLFPNLEGISSMLTAFKILRAASQADASPDWYSILQEKMSSVKSVGLEGEKGSGETIRSVGLRRKVSDENLKEKERGGGDDGSVAGKVDDGEEKRSRSKRVKVAEETMTLAEMKWEMKQKANQGREKLNLKEKVNKAGEKEKKRDRREPPKNRVSKIEKQKASEKSKDFEIGSQGPSKMSGNLGIMTRATKKISVDLEARTQEGGKKNQNSELTKQGTSRKKVKLDIKKRCGSKSGDMKIMAVEDSDFYDFDKDRLERNFKRGQVWAIYDDDDGMPRHYGLIEEVFTVNPFELKMSWLDFQNNGDDRLISWEKRGFHVSCGRFKAARKSSINSVNIFSHMVECERAAKELYRIYPKKGSVWALYNEAKSGAAGRNFSARDKHCYDIVVFLTTYSEIHGLSMAYLEKVDGFRTIFKRQEIGCQAIRWLEKDDIRLFSHQIPARKLSSDDVPDLLKDCWELDPTSLPPDLLAIGLENVSLSTLRRQAQGVLDLPFLPLKLLDRFLLEAIANKTVVGLE